MKAKNGEEKQTSLARFVCEDWRNTTDRFQVIRNVCPATGLLQVWRPGNFTLLYLSMRPISSNAFPLVKKVSTLPCCAQEQRTRIAAENSRHFTCFRSYKLPQIYLTLCELAKAMVCKKYQKRNFHMLRSVHPRDKLPIAKERAKNRTREECSLPPEAN